MNRKDISALGLGKSTFGKLSRSQCIICSLEGTDTSIRFENFERNLNL